MCMARERGCAAFLLHPHCRLPFLFFPSLVLPLYPLFLSHLPRAPSPLPIPTSHICPSLPLTCPPTSFSSNFLLPLLPPQMIDGEAFLLLTQADIVKIMSVKLGPALKIYNAILMFKNTDDTFK